MKDRNMYIVVDGPVEKSTGFTKEEFDNFIDRFVALVEEFGAVTACSFKLMTEEEYGESLKDDDDDTDIHFELNSITNN